MSVFGYDYGCTPSNLADASAKFRLELTDSDTAFSHVVLLSPHFIICGHMNLTQFSRKPIEKQDSLCQTDRPGWLLAAVHPDEVDIRRRWRAELYGVTTKCPQIAAFHAPHCDSGEHLLRAWHGPRAHLCLSGTQVRTLRCERAPRARAGTPLSLDSAGAILRHSWSAYQGGAPLRQLVLVPRESHGSFRSREQFWLHRAREDRALLTELPEQFSVELCSRSGLPNDKRICSTDIHDTIVVQLSCEDAWTKRPVPTNIDAPEENNESHSGIIEKRAGWLRQLGTRFGCARIPSV